MNTRKFTPLQASAYTRGATTAAWRQTVSISWHQIITGCRRNVALRGSARRCSPSIKAARSASGGISRHRSSFHGHLTVGLAYLGGQARAHRLWAAVISAAVVVPVVPEPAIVPVLGLYSAERESSLRRSPIRSMPLSCWHPTLLRAGGRATTQPLRSLLAASRTLIREPTRQDWQVAATILSTIRLALIPPRTHCESCTTSPQGSRSRREAWGEAPQRGLRSGSPRRGSSLPTAAERVRPLSISDAATRRG